MVRYALLAAAVLSLATWWAQAQPTSSARTVGRCTVVTVRSGSQPGSPDPPGCGAAQGVDSGAFAALSKWAPSFLEYAFNQAELAQCGYPTCATSDREVRIVLVADGAVHASVTRSLSGSIEFRISSALVDFTAAAATSFTKEVVAAREGKQLLQGFSWWLDTMRSFGGQACRAAMPWPDSRADRPEDFLSLVQIPSQSIYQLVFGHELAHLASGGRCGAMAGASPLDVESSCDQMALERLSRGRGLMPVVTVAWLTALHFYESLQGALAAGGSIPGTTIDFFPARDWRTRADRLLMRWAELCKGGLGKGATCLPGWEDGVAEGRRLLKLNAPTACTRSTPVSVGQSPPDAGFCSSLKSAVSATSTNFEKIRGGQSSVQDGDRIFSSTLQIAGARECSIWQYADSTTRFQCPIVGNGEPSTATHAVIAGKVKACLPSWAISEEQSGTRVKSHVISARSGGIAVKVIHTPPRTAGTSSVTLAVERHE
jgi:hypothetical protein